jgi:heat shock protein HtpX
MGVALFVLVVVSVTITLFAIGLTGMTVLAMLSGLRLYLLDSEGGGTIAGLEVLWQHPGPVVIGSGVVLFLVLYLGPVRQSIKSFRDDLGTGGSPADETHPEIAAMVKRLAQQANTQAPTVYVVEDEEPKSHALGSKADGTIIVSTRLVDALSEDELEAVLAHELSHLLNGDSRIMSLALIPVLVADRIGADPPEFSGWHPIGSVLLWLLWALVRAVVNVQKQCSMVGVGTLSRGRELAADRAAAKLTGEPSALASALATVTDTHEKPKRDKRSVKRASQALNIVSPSHSVPEEFRNRSRLTRTHPDTETRIDRLEAMVTEMETNS